MPDAVLHWLTTLPVGYAIVATYLVFVFLLVFLWSRPAAEIFDGAPDRSRWRDIRLLGTVLIIVQLAIYQFFR
ncbi:MAG: hypothetical protein AAGI15_03060 [Pseudomonadota bacterium]